VGEGFVPDAKWARVEFVCEMWGGGRSLREACPISWWFFIFCNHGLFVLDTKSLVQH